MRNRKKRKNQNSANLEKLKSKFLADNPFKGKQIVINSRAEKMSEVLMEFIEPYKEYATTPEATRRLIIIAIIAWNAAINIYEESEKQDIITQLSEQVMGASGKEGKKDFLNFTRLLIERKKRYFAENNRYILDYQIVDSKDNYHLSVISTAYP